MLTTAAQIITHGLNTSYQRGCRCTQCRTAHATDTRNRYRRRHGTPKPTKVEAEVAAMLRSGQIRPFVAPPCRLCGQSLCDSDGQPRWDVVGDLMFICLESCHPEPKPGLLRRQADLL